MGSSGLKLVVCGFGIKAISEQIQVEDGKEGQDEGYLDQILLMALWVCAQLHGRSTAQGVTALCPPWGAGGPGLICSTVCCFTFCFEPEGSCSVHVNPSWPERASQNAAMRRKWGILRCSGAAGEHAVLGAEAVLGAGLLSNVVRPVGGGGRHNNKTTKSRIKMSLE